PGVDAERALVVGGERSVRLGWTQVQIAGNSWDEAMLIRHLSAAGRMPVRIYDAIRGPSEDAERLLAEGAIVENGFILRGIKVSVDGALGSRGAALHEPYAAAAARGLLTWDRKRG